jgi:hypothetical protein
MVQTNALSLLWHTHTRDIMTKLNLDVGNRCRGRRRSVRERPAVATVVVFVGKDGAQNLAAKK